MIVLFNILGTDEGNEEKKDILNYWSDVIYEPRTECKGGKSESKYINCQKCLWSPVPPNKYDTVMVCDWLQSSLFTWSFRNHFNMLVCVCVCVHSVLLLELMLTAWHLFAWLINILHHNVMSLKAKRAVFFI